jgi:hypothetical protein
MFHRAGCNRPDVPPGRLRPAAHLSKTARRADRGAGVVGGSFMSGTTTWAVAGPIIALAGLALIALALRRPRR